VLASVRIIQATNAGQDHVAKSAAAAVSLNCINSCVYVYKSLTSMQHLMSVKGGFRVVVTEGMSYSNGLQLMHVMRK
jgi:hypothetical protein